MNVTPFRIEKLEPMRIASVRVVSESPERDAWRKLRAWAAPRGLLADPSRHVVFGFNNPPPVPGRRRYGYELWIAIERDTPIGEGEIEVKDFPGGLYAVATCQLCGDPTRSVRDIWRRLWESVQTGPFRWRGTHELERPHDPAAATAEMVLDLYLPIEPREESIT